MSNKRVTKVEVILFKIIDDQPLFLLLKRQPERGGFWQPVTGGVEKGEDLKEAALREIEEETGIKNFVKVLENIHYFEFEANGGFGWMKEYVFGVEVHKEAESVISDEHSEQKWCSFSEALDLLKYENNKEGFRKINKLYD